VYLVHRFRIEPLLRQVCRRWSLRGGLLHRGLSPYGFSSVPSAFLSPSLVRFYRSCTPAPLLFFGYSSSHLVSVLSLLDFAAVPVLSRRGVAVLFFPGPFSRSTRASSGKERRCLDSPFSLFFAGFRRRRRFIPPTTPPTHPYPCSSPALPEWRFPIWLSFVVNAAPLAIFFPLPPSPLLR